MATIAERIRSPEKVEDGIRDGHFIQLIFINIAIAFLTGLLAAWLMGWFWFGLMVGMLTWATLLLKTPLVSTMFVEVEKLHGAVFSNQLKSEPRPHGEGERTSIQPAVSLRETDWGWRGKYPWERLIIIDLNDQLVLTSALTVYTKDNVELLIECVLVLTPLRGSLVNLVRTSEDAAKNNFTAKMEDHARKTFKLFNEDEVYGASEDGTPVVRDRFQKEFENVFGGPNRIDPLEERYGLYSNTPLIKKIERTKEYQEVAVAAKVADGMIGAVTKLKNVLGDLSPDVAAAVGLALIGKEAGNMHVISGLPQNLGPGSLDALRSLGIHLGKKPKGGDK